MLDKCKKLLLKLIFGKDKATKPLIPAIKNQCKNIKRIWNNDTYSDFGIERIFRLFLASIQFGFPGLYIRHLSGLYGFKYRKLIVELWVIIKLLIPIVLLWSSSYRHPLAFYLTVYLLIETILYLFSLIFLSDTYARPVSGKRSILALIMNYIEISLDFSVIYGYLASVLPDFFNGHQTTNALIYFSFVTSATVGYGDICVKNDIGRWIVVTQIVTSFVFVVLFFNFFSINSKENSYFTDKPKQRGDLNGKAKSEKDQ